MKGLSEDQIQQLYTFTRKHFVEHYDLQTELVDHLANGIEEQKTKHSAMTFDQALKLEFKKFGVYGFHDVIKEKTKAMEKRYWNFLLRYYSEYFKMPKIVTILACILTMGIIFGQIAKEYKYDIFLGILFFISLSTLLTIFRSRRKYELEQVRHGKKWLLKDQIYGIGDVHSIVNFFPIVLNFVYFRDLFSNGSIYLDIAFAFLVVSLSVFCYVAIFLLPQKAEKLLEETYPEYKMVLNRP